MSNTAETRGPRVGATPDRGAPGTETSDPSAPVAETPDAETLVAGLSFEAALAELEQVVAKLEHGDVPLERSIALYARGAELRRHCEARLKAAEEQVALITEGPDGELRAKPADIG